MQVLDAPDGALYLKMDERDFRYVIVPGTTDRYFASGWEVPDGAAFDAALATLQQAGVEAVRATRERVREGSAERSTSTPTSGTARRASTTRCCARATGRCTRCATGIRSSTGTRPTCGRRACLQGVRDDDRRRRDAPGAASREPR